MFIHPNLREARPLMVVGAPRCGTRFVASALNRSPMVRVHGEIPWQAMDNAVRFLSETTNYFTSAPEWAASWQYSRKELIYALWTSMVKGRPRAIRTAKTWFGHKTPRHDQYWKFYKDFLPDARLKYIFCMRNFVDHYLSMNSMNERHRIDLIARDYRVSVARYAEMKAALGEDISLFVLDDLGEGGVDYLRRTLFEGLGIDVDDRTLSRIDVSRRANSTESAGRSRRTELSAEERKFLERNTDLLDALQALRAARPLTGTANSKTAWKRLLSPRRRCAAAGAGEGAPGRGPDSCAERSADSATS
jgi:Sulfotransferase family